MKRFIMVVSAVVVLFIAIDFAIYRMGWYVDTEPDQAPTTFTKVDDEWIYLNKGQGFERFEIVGVNMGSGEPGQWSTDFDIAEEVYLEWFQQMKDMGANTLRIYTVQSEPFYNAFYEFNKDNPDPLYLIHGVWVNDYIQNSHRHAYDDEFYQEFKDNCIIMIDAVHGNRKQNLGDNASAGHGVYDKDISPWVIGYILGVEWEGSTVRYTDEKFEAQEEYASFEGEYFYTTEDARPFEAMLARVGETVVDYETTRYKQQRIIAFSNWATTDPFVYPLKMAEHFQKVAQVDVEHIKTKQAFLAGQFASYHVYPYYPDYLIYVDDWEEMGRTNGLNFYQRVSRGNSYHAYLEMLTEHHDMPVVISEYGVSTGRGMAQRDRNTGRNQGNMSEQEQGQAIIDCYEDIISAGCAGSCVFSWQDEWFKRTWNTMHAVDLTRTPYWSDYQTNEQYFGLLSFDPGEERSICYVDGDVSEWTEEDVVTQSEDLTLSMKYDEKYLYFRVNKPGLDFENEVIYLPIDVTPKSGSTYCENNGLRFERPVDFLITLDGKDNSRMQVQERYEALRSTYSIEVYQIDSYEKAHIPDIDSPEFRNIDLILQVLDLTRNEENAEFLCESYETGDFTYGNGNPYLPNFNSLSDFICSGDDIEIRLPWQLFNFADPSRMNIHDDYYDGNYGIEYIKIDELYIGITQGGNGRIPMAPLELKGWGNKVTSHQRLKQSYYMLQDYWNALHGT